ncbi:MAG: hypothetical protein J3K34DRAFT_517116 [Monoraphidium minutum]|nr:MAG: hypothetical protein J3K34DRAFT_517116 [Monoraphidium minutum]
MAVQVQELETRLYHSEELRRPHAWPQEEGAHEQPGAGAATRPDGGGGDTAVLGREQVQTQHAAPPQQQQQQQQQQQHAEHAAHASAAAAAATTGASTATRPAPLSHGPAAAAATPPALAPAPPRPRPAADDHRPPSPAPAAADADDGAGDWLQRTRLLVGEEGLAKLAATRVLLVGLGGVGSYAAEFLARAGVGALTIVDGDCVDTTNRNRQLPALASTEGRPKAEVVASRLLDINPRLELTARQEFLDPESTRALVASERFDFVIDAIDSIAPKQHLLLAAVEAGVKVVSSMGAGGRVDPSRVRTADLQDTYGDPFAANIRRGLRKKGVGRGVVAVFSDEPVRRASLGMAGQQYKKSYYGTISYLPALFGLWISQHVIRDALGEPGYAVRARPPPARRPPAAPAEGGGPTAGQAKLQRRRAGRMFISIRRGATGVGVGFDGSGI